MNAWQMRDTTLNWGERTYLMGVLNLTPDSFSDGGVVTTIEAALDRVEAMLPFIDLLDIGGESTRPGAEPVSAAEERARVIPTIEAVRARYPQLPISLDTMKASVAAAGIAAGVDMINDVSAGRFDPDMLPLVAKSHLPIVLMHMQGRPKTMQQEPQYQNVLEDIVRFFHQAIAVSSAWGISPDRIMLDPGIGFGKSVEHNLEILRKLPCIRSGTHPLLVGVSRKSFIGSLCQAPDPTQRVWGTAAACTIAVAGGADMLRVHDVQAMKAVCQVADGIYR